MLLQGGMANFPVDGAQIHVEMDCLMGGLELESA